MKAWIDLQIHKPMPAGQPGTRFIYARLKMSRNNGRGAKRLQQYLKHHHPDATGFNVLDTSENETTR